MPGPFTNHANGRDGAPPPSVFRSVASRTSHESDERGWASASPAGECGILPHGETKMNKTSTKMNTCGGGGGFIFTKLSRMSPATSAGTTRPGGEANDRRIHRDGRQLFPLPWGEGQGEGQTGTSSAGPGHSSLDS